MLGLKRKPETDLKWQSPFDTLRKKWTQVPTWLSKNQNSVELLALPDAELLEHWEAIRDNNTTGAGFAMRGWYHLLYAEALHGKKLLDVGSGLGISTITFAQQGADVTFVDLAQTNLDVLRRLCGILGLRNVTFHLLDGIESLAKLPESFDVITAIGSLHHAPQSVIRPECAELVRHLKVGGRWLQLAYPRSRWEGDRKPDFDRWGEITDGVGTPWSEWYDVPKLLDVLLPAKFEVVLYHEFSGVEFNWFDLLRTA